MKRNERRRMARQQSLPVEQQKSSTWWEGTEDMAPFPCSYDMSHEHTIHEHTLRSTHCPIATYHKFARRGVERCARRSLAPGARALEGE